MNDVGVHDVVRDQVQLLAAEPRKHPMCLEAVLNPSIDGIVMSLHSRVATGMEIGRSTSLDLSTSLHLRSTSRSSTPSL